MKKQKRVLMIVQNPKVKGGIASVVNGYYGSPLEDKYDISYIQSYTDTSKFGKLLYALRAYWIFFWKLIFKKTNLIHIHSSFGASFYRQIPFIEMARMFKVPVLNHIHGPNFDEFYENASPKKKKKIVKIYNKCTRIITLSKEWKKIFAKVVPEDKITILENYSIVVNNLDFSKRHKNQVLFLGAINERKGVYNLPEVIQLVIKEIPEASFVIAGDGELQQLKSIIFAKGLQKSCYFPGWVRGEEKDKLLKESSLFFLPSYYEGMPMAILDAMGYSLPIISTNVGGIPNLVSEKNGLLFKPTDTNGMAKGIIKILKNESLRLQMSEESHNIALARFSFDKHLSNLENIYDSILEVKNEFN